MIAFSDKAKIAHHWETNWGEIPRSSFVNLHINSENLTPIVNAVELDQLAGTNPRLITEKLVGGDIEAPLTAAALASFMPPVLQEETCTLDSYTQGSARVYSSRDFELPGVLAAHCMEDDYIWLQADGGLEAGFMQVVLRNNKIVFKDKPPLGQLVNPAIKFSKLTTGKKPVSTTIIRRYDPDDRWHALTGLLVQRLVMDIEEDRPALMTASLIGKAMQTIPHNPRVIDNRKLDPLDPGHHIKKFVLIDPETDTTVDTTDLVITGIRIVFDRIGLTPQFGLGDLQPRMILPGRLGISGSIAMLLSGDRFFDWLESRTRIKLLLIMSSGKTGFVLSMPNLEISGLDGGLRNSDQPVRAVFHFVDSPGTENPVTLYFNT